jgi:hypothetical protein
MKFFNNFNMSDLVITNYRSSLTGEKSCSGCGKCNSNEELPDHLPPAGITLIEKSGGIEGEQVNPWGNRQFAPGEEPEPLYPLGIEIKRNIKEE